jgi:hypothetical protein
MSSSTSLYLKCPSCGEILLKNLLLPISETSKPGYNYNMFVCMTCNVTNETCCKCWLQRWMSSAPVININDRDCHICNNKMKLVYYNDKTQGYSLPPTHM